MLIGKTLNFFVANEGHALLY